MSETVELETPPEPETSPTWVGRGAVETVAFRGIGLPLSFAISIVTSRYLLATGRGAYVLGLLTVTLVGTLLGNIGTSLVHEVGRDPASAAGLLKRAVVLTTALGVVASIMLVPIDLSLADQDYRVVTFAVAGLTPLLLSQTIGSMLLAVNRVRTWNVLQIVLPAATLAAMLVFVVALSKGVTGAITGWVIGQTVAALFALFVTRQMWWPLAGLRGGGRMRSMLLLGLRIGFVNLVSLINYRVELIVLERYHGLTGVGVYSLATSLAELLWVLSSAVSTALIAPAIHADDRRAIELLSKGVRHTLLATGAAAAALAALSPWLIPLVFGQTFERSVTPLLILLPGIVIFAPGTILAVFFSMRLGRARYPFWIALGSAATTCVLAVVLIPALGTNGAALACIVGYSSSMVIAWFWFVRLSDARPLDFVPRWSDAASYLHLVRRVLARV